VDVPWLRQIVTGLSPWRPGFDNMPIHVDSVVEKWHWDSFLLNYCKFLPSVTWHQCPILIHSYIHQCYIVLGIDGIVKKCTSKMVTRLFSK
jgi:hypothetical protein